MSMYMDERTIAALKLMAVQRGLKDYATIARLGIVSYLERQKDEITDKRLLQEIEYIVSTEDMRLDMERLQFLHKTLKVLLAHGHDYLAKSHFKHLDTIRDGDLLKTLHAINKERERIQRGLKAKVDRGLMKDGKNI